MPPAAAAQQIENAPGHQLADYRLNVTASDIRLIRDPVSANPSDPRLDDPIGARFAARLPAAAGDDD
jgi:hypothetical protein